MVFLSQGDILFFFFFATVNCLYLANANQVCYVCSLGERRQIESDPNENVFTKCVWLE